MIDKNTFIEQVVVPRQRVIHNTAVEANKRLRSQQLEIEVAEYLKRGGVIHQVGKVGPAKAKFNDKDTSKILNGSEGATVSEINGITEWVAARKGRQQILGKQLGKSGSHISRITRFFRPCSKAEYLKIKEAMKIVEQMEKAA